MKAASRKKIGGASTKLATILIVIVVVMIAAWGFGTAQGHGIAMAYARTEARQYVQGIESRDALIDTLSIKVAEQRSQITKMLTPNNETVFDCFFVEERPYAP
jgi:hypothetical protein